jgi:predicted HTH transcriptional regulator
VKQSELDILLHEGEGSMLEYKESLSASLVRELVAFANSHGGKILLGVRDDGAVVGLRDSNDLRARIQDMARNCDPPVKVLVEPMAEVMVLTIRESENKPVQCREGFFWRQGAGTQKLTRDEIRDFFRSEEVPEYPMRALREAITNAVMHRDYFEMGANVFVEIYDDRIEVTNPGGLPKGLSRSELGTRSVRRNQLIADLLHRIGFIEKAGTGIHRMQDEAREHKCPAPQFTANGFFTAIFRPTREGVHEGMKSGRKRKQATEQATEQAAEQVAAVLDAARRPRSREELQDVVGLKHRPHFIKAYLQPLLANGWLEMTIPDKPRSPNQRYRTTEHGLQVLGQWKGNA